MRHPRSSLLPVRQTPLPYGAMAIAVWLLAVAPAAADSGLLQRLSDTGLYTAGTHQVAAGVLPFAPQYPLWSDGATKRRWLYLPPGSRIDASRPDAWEFPPGTRLWKEFSHGRPIETRMLERLDDGSWRYAAYVWDASLSDAWLAGEDGIPAMPSPTSPGGRYDIPARIDCLACHEGAAVPVLGVSALQLSPDRDPQAVRAEEPPPGSVDLVQLHELGLLANLSEGLLATPPRIAATSPVERAALGYLHANCGNCHNDAGPMLAVDMLLAQGPGRNPAAALDSLVRQPSELHVYGYDTRIVPGNASASVLTLRMRSRNPVLQMPPLGTRIVDDEGVALVENWIQQMLQPDQEIN